MAEVDPAVAAAAAANDGADEPEDAPALAPGGFVFGAVFGAAPAAPALAPGGFGGFGLGAMPAPAQRGNYFNDENVDVAAAVAAAAAANDGTAELAAATAAVLPRDLPQRPCAGINEFLSVIGAEPLLRSLNHAGRAGVARWSQTRVAAARSVLLDQLGADDARVEDASRNLKSAALAALEGDGGVGIKNARFKMLVRLVPRSAQKSLFLFGNNIGDAGAQALAPELPHTGITELHLQGNHIGAAGAQALAPELPHTCITHLYLNANHIGDAGAQALAPELPHTPLTTLNLTANNIGDAAKQAIRAALPNARVYCSARKRVLLN